MKTILPIAICAVLLCAILCIAGIVIHTKNENQREKQELSNSLYLEELENLKNERDEYEKEQKETQEKLKNYTVYQRFADGSFPIYVLYLGDATMYGAGVNPNTQSFRILLKQMYRDFTKNAIGTEISSRVNTEDVFKQALSSVKAYVGTYPLHLTYLCVDSDEKYTDYASNYEAIVRAAKEASDKADVVCIIHHNQSSEDAESIKKIAAHYGTLLVDMRSAFEDAGASSLESKDGIPNVEGNKLYADTIFAELKKAINESKAIKPTPSEPLFAQQ